jgi:peptide/nickel transport system substrate-binding protein
MKQTHITFTALCAACLLAPLALLACSKPEELSEEDIQTLTPSGVNEIIAKTTTKPWKGEAFIPGVLKGSWISATHADPKSFNMLIAESDSATAGVVAMMHEYLVDYDVIKREWQPLCATPEVVVHEEAGTLDVIYTLRENLFWSYYLSDRKEPVTSDDVVFWYNEISGDAEFQSSSFYQQFVTMQDGREMHVDIERLDERRFVFHFPRIVAEPLLATNMDFGPRHIYQAAKQRGGVEAVRALFSVDTDPKTIPSMGKWFLAEYTVGQRLVFQRNPYYWNKDVNGVSIPYIETQVVQIVPEENTQFLLFKEGSLESYTARPEDLDELVNASSPAYTVFNADGALSARFWTFNQNPANKDTPQYEWFTQTAFRQAMSCLLNRDRIITQVYRGLAEPKLTVYPEPSRFYDASISLQYTYNTAKALELLASIGMKQDSGVLRDAQGRAVEFDLTIQSEDAVVSDTASIIVDELSKIGVKVNIRVLEFQKMVEQLFSTYQWQSLIIGLSGSGIFPSQGSNTWPSNGNLHLWHPNQPSPATDWEARLDYLYNEGCYTIDAAQATAYWDEFQRIVLEQCPIVYLLRSRSFTALSNRWDMTNVYYDNLNGFETNYVFLAR